MTILSFEQFIRNRRFDEAANQWIKRPDFAELEKALASLDLPEGEIKPLAENIRERAKLFLENTKKVDPQSSNYFREFFEFFVSTLELIFDVFGIHSLFGKKDFEWEEDQKSYRVMNLITFIGTISGTVLPLFGIEHGTKMVATALGVVMIAGLLFERFKPIPRSLPRGENWTFALREGKLHVLDGDEKYKKQIAEALKTKKKVMLIGETGVGKTETAKAFAAAVEQGSFPELKGKVVFYFNTADVLDQIGGTVRGNLLPRINHFIGRNSEDVIVIFDEFHTACEGLMSDQMKTQLDPDSGRFPYFIGITTKQELQHFEKQEQQALLRRFEPIEIERPDEDGLKKMLADLILSEMPEALLDASDTVIETLLQKTNANTDLKALTPYQVHHAIEVLRRCFELISERQSEEPDATIIEQANQIARLASKEALSGQYLSENATLKSQVVSMEETRQKEQAARQTKRDFFALRKIHLTLRRDFYQTALRIADATHPDDDDLKRFDFLGRTFLPLMNKKLIERGKELNVKTVIDASLIDQAIQDILKRRRSQKMHADN